MSTVSFKLKGSTGTYGTDVILKNIDKEGEEVLETVKVKYKDGVVLAETQEMINYFNDRNDHMNVTNSDALLQEAQKENATLRKENKDLVERLEEYEKVPKTTAGANPKADDEPKVSVGDVVSFPSGDETLEGEVSSVNNKEKAIVIVDGEKHKNIPFADLTIVPNEEE